MKLLLIHNIFWSHYKAAVFSELWKFCRAQKTELRIVHIAKTESGRQFLSTADADIHSYPYQILFDASLDTISFKNRFFALCRAINNFKPTVVIVPGYYDLAVVAAAYYAKICGAKIVMSIDSNSYGGGRRCFGEFLKRLLLKPVNLFFCYGAMAKRYLRALGIAENKIKIRIQATANGQIIEANRKLSVNKKECNVKNFIYVGRFSSEKNLLSMFKAYQSIKNPGWGLIMVGDGPLRSNLESFVAENQLQNVCFVGPQKWDEVVRYYAMASVLVLPSLVEPWGVVVNEAMLCKLPAIVSNHCGASELIKPNVNGWVFDPENLDELKNIFNDIVLSKYDLFEMGCRAYEKIQTYTPERAALEMLEGISLMKGAFHER